MMKLKTSKGLNRNIGSLRQPGLQLREVLHAFVIGFDLKLLNSHPKYSIFHFLEKFLLDYSISYSLLKRFELFFLSKNYLTYLRMTLEISRDPSNERRHIVDDEEIGISDSALNQES